LLEGLPKKRFRKSTVGRLEKSKTSPLSGKKKKGRGGVKNASG